MELFGSGKQFKKNIGSRAEVWHGTAKKTSGGLIKSKLRKNKNGRIVSKKLSIRSKKSSNLPKKYIKQAKSRKGKSFQLITD